MNTSLLRVSTCCLLLLLVGPLVGGGVIHQARAETLARVAVDPPNISDLSVAVGDTVTFTVNLADAPAINGYFVQLTYNRNVLDALSLDYSSNVLESTRGSLSVVRNCINNVYLGCQSDDGPNVVSFAIFVLGLRTTPPTNGLLFSVNFNVIANGFSAIHLRDVALSSGQIGPDGQPVPVPVSSFDGHFTNIDCPNGSGILCTPLTVDFTVSPAVPTTGSLVTFNASTSLATNSGATITLYSWDWGDGGPGEQTANPITSHIFTNRDQPVSGKFLVTLTVTDSYGVTWSLTKTVTVNVPSDFSMRVITSDGSPGFQVIAGKAVTVPLEVSSLGEFNGVVTLTASVHPINYFDTNITSSLGSSSLTLRGGKNSTELTVSADRDSGEGSTFVIVTGTSGGFSHSLTLVVHVVRPEVWISCLPNVRRECFPFFVAQGGGVDFPIFVSAHYGFNGTVTLSTTSSQGVSSHVSQNIVQLEANQTIVLVCTVSTSPQTSLGSYDLTLSGAGLGAITRNMEVAVEVATPPLPPDFFLSAPSSLSLQAGSNATLQFAVSSVNGYSNGFLLAAVEIIPSTLDVQARFPGFSTPFFTPLIFGLAAGQSVHIPFSLSTSISTRPGSYIATIEVFAPSKPYHVFTVTLNVLPPPVPPILIQFHWKHRVSLSIRGLGAGTQTFVAGVYNPNNSTTLYLSVRVDGVDQSGRIFTSSSQVVKLLPEQSLTNIKIANAFDPSTVGSTFAFTTTIAWGVDPLALSQTSSPSGSGVPDSGSFSIVP